MSQGIRRIQAIKSIKYAKYLIRREGLCVFINTKNIKLSTRYLFTINCQEKVFLLKKLFTKDWAPMKSLKICFILCFDYIKWIRFIKRFFTQSYH